MLCIFFFFGILSNTHTHTFSFAIFSVKIIEKKLRITELNNSTGNDLSASECVCVCEPTTYIYIGARKIGSYIEAVVSVDKSL